MDTLPLMPIATASDWAGLPTQLLDLVLEKLESVKDCLQFSFVCHSWQSIAKDNKSKLVKLSRHQVPMLLVPRESKDNTEWDLYNVLDNKFLPSKLVLPPYDRPFIGSSEGWLLTVDESSSLTLYKPFAERGEKTIIHLPPLFSEEYAKLVADHREYHVMKMTTFAPNPVSNPNDLILVVICGDLQSLAYIRPAKDSSWTYVADDMKSTNNPYSITNSFHDVVYYNDKVYALTMRGGILTSIDVTDSFELNIKSLTDGIPSDYGESDYEDFEEDDYEPYEYEENEYEQYQYEEEEEDNNDNDDDGQLFFYKRYLVESFKGDLLQVKRYREWNDNQVTVLFKVFKLSLDVLKWVKIKNLGDEALFLGDNTSVSVLASNFVGCQKNSIYFTQDKDSIGFSEHGPWDLGVYTLETRVCTRGFTIDAATFTKMVGRTPVWVLPSLYI